MSELILSVFETELRIKEIEKRLTLYNKLKGINAMSIKYNVFLMNQFILPNNSSISHSVILENLRRVSK